ncbi:MAG: hypothetical protein ISS71_03905 [Phycisphaerae bacterium]|nr:hypothetical protein [Phycisphaerae bacterium]
MLPYERMLKPKQVLSNFPLVALLAANALPLVGVLFFGWDAFAIVLLYWTENLVIGFYNILKMVFAEVPHSAMHLGKFFTIPFFIIHYGGFTAVHGLFVLMMFHQSANPFPQGHAWPCFFVFLQLLVNVICQILSIIPPNMLYAIAGLFISHGISFGYNYLYKGEYQQKSLKTLMGEPYGRIVVMHIAIIAGAFLTMTIGSPVGILIMLVILKTIFDVKLHLRQHRVKDLKA